MTVDDTKLAEFHAARTKALHEYFAPGASDFDQGLFNGLEYAAVLLGIKQPEGWSG